MRREEKRRKFYEAVLNTLFPTPPQRVDRDESANVLHQGFVTENLSGDQLAYRTGSSSASDDGDGDNEREADEPRNLSRAQRKKIRKKKVKEDASRRRQIIGPLLPSTSDTRNGGEEEEEEDGFDEKKSGAQGVRRNASEESDHMTGEQPACGGTAQSKSKQRRMAKKLCLAKLEILYRRD